MAYKDKEKQLANRRKHYQENRQYYIDKAKRNNSTYRARNRRYIIEYLREHPCVDCGNDDIEVLDFDHRDPSIKVASIASMLVGQFQKLVDEIKKCDVRCRN